MSRTIRTVNPRTAKWARRMDNPRKAAMLLKGAAHYRSNKCSEASVDDEGNHKLNTWSETMGKAGTLANRKIRNAGKTQIRRQLEQDT